MRNWRVRQGTECALKKNGSVWGRIDSRMRRKVSPVQPDSIRHPDVETRKFLYRNGWKRNRDDGGPQYGHGRGNAHRYFPNAEMGSFGTYPFPIGRFKRRMRNQTLARPMVFGSGCYSDGGNRWGFRY